MQYCPKCMGQAKKSGQFEHYAQCPWFQQYLVCVPDFGEKLW